MIGHRRRAASVMALLTTALLSVPSPRAEARTLDALTRCRLGGGPDWSQTVDVQGNGGGSVPTGTNPPNILNHGDVFMVRPLLGDRVRINLWGTNYGPDGNATAAPSGWPFPGRFQFSEILRFNNNPGGWVGDPDQATAFPGCRRWEGGLPVRFLFYVNDPETWDNGGRWATSVHIWRGP
ncbi:hypothetical protein [Nonomuraea typhae]|uniref:Secreted protein n=1 Tax=Nonomuraea typhae TaxID=2603600 RepID=A0ABW7Z564_9ACTN